MDSMSNICPLDYRYGSEDMKVIFSEESRLQYQMNVEAALAKAHVLLGTITKKQADEINRIANLNIVKIERVKEIELETKHDVMAMVKAMTEQCEGDAGKFIHYGATSNDIIDTATALQVKAAIEIIQHDIESFIVTLAKLAKREKGTIEIGRTHAQFAIPITFGFKISGYVAEMLRHRERLIQIKPRVCIGKMSGAVGTGAALGRNFLKIQETVMSSLDISYEPAATQVVGRDRYSELICLMANIATSLERYATEIRNLQRSEISEVAEPFDKEKQVGSSTMAHKRNPMISENVCGLARIVRSMVTPMFESQVLWHERDLTNSSAERFIIPHTFILLDEILKKMETTFSNLEVYRDNMKRNIEASKGLVMAESLMMKMTEKGIGRQDAHEIVRTLSMIANDENKHLKDVFLERKGVASLMSENDILSAMDPNNYIGASEDIVDKMVAEVKEILNVEV